MSTKFHITRAGRTEPCGATVKACPLGEANHYGSLQEAVQASIAGVAEPALNRYDTHRRVVEHWEDSDEMLARFEADLEGLDGVGGGRFFAVLREVRAGGGTPQQVTDTLHREEASVPAEKKLSPAQAWREWAVEGRESREKIPAEKRDLLFKGFLKTMERDIRGAGIEGFLSEHRTRLDLTGLSDEEFAKLREAHTKPIRLTPSEQREVNDRLSKLGVTQQEVEDYADGRIIVVPKWRGQPHYFHPSRHVAARGLAQGLPYAYEAVARDYMADKAESARNPNHRYGSYAKKVELPTSGGSSGPKGIDPAFIEALQKMYMAKFGKHPDADGVDVGQLIAMFNKGELA